MSGLKPGPISETRTTAPDCRREMTADEVKKALGLRPHPVEGGWFVRTYEATELIAARAFEDGRYGGPRLTGTAIYYMLEPDTFSEMHRLKSDEVFHFYMGDAVEMLRLKAGGGGAAAGGGGARNLAGFAIGEWWKLGVAGLLGESGI